MLVEFWQWVHDKFDVLFSGLGIYVISTFFAIVGFFLFRKRSSGSNKVYMSNIKAGGDVTGRDKKG